MTILPLCENPLDRELRKFYGLPTVPNPDDFDTRRSSLGVMPLYKIWELHKIKKLNDPITDIFGSDWTIPELQQQFNLVLHKDCKSSLCICIEYDEYTLKIKEYNITCGRRTLQAISCFFCGKLKYPNTNLQYTDLPENEKERIRMLDIKVEIALKFLPQYEQQKALHELSLSLS